MKPFLTQFPFTAAQLSTIHATTSLYYGLSIRPVLLYSWIPTIIQFSHLARKWSFNGLLLSPTLNSLPVSRFSFYFPTSPTSSLNLVLYDFFRELAALPPSMGNSVAKF
jgi:hypothetical protein